MADRFYLKGTFIDTPTPAALRIRKGYMLCEDGLCGGFFDTPSLEIPVYDYSNALITPGLVDLHLHAPQYSYRGIAMDVQLLEWLERYTFPEEGRYVDVAYARKGYRLLTDDLKASPTTRACIFATLHTDATLELMRQLEEAHIPAYVGKLNMDRNSPDSYREPDAETGLRETLLWLDACGDFQLVHPIITPRFTPSVTDEYMRLLGGVIAERKLPVQSHLSESAAEIDWVRALCPDTDYYAQTYSRFGLFGEHAPSLMAHCIYSCEEEQRLMKANNVMIAHCPTSNNNVIAGICPATHYLRGGWKIGLGSDVAGGHTLNLFAVMAAAIQQSKLRWLYIDPSEAPLTVSEVLWMATAGGGEFFGKVGLFEPGYAFDAIILNDREEKAFFPFTEAERLERLLYKGDADPEAKFVGGVRLF